MSAVQNTGIMEQVHKGMEVHTKDGHKVGKVTAVWYGTDPSASSPLCDEDICSRVEVHHGFLGRTALYVPYNAIDSVSSDRLVLNIDEPGINERGWNKRPNWIE